LNRNTFTAASFRGVVPRSLMIANASSKAFSESEKLIQEHLKGDKAIKVGSITLAGCDAKRLESESDFGPEIVYKNTDVFLAVKNSASPVLYKMMMLSYNRNESPTRVNTFRTAFDQVLNSIEFTAGTQCLGLF
jgi:hypothetical protein